MIVRKRIGIGNTSPTGALDVKSGTQPQLKVATASATADRNAGFLVNVSNSATPGSRSAKLSLDADGGDGSGTDNLTITKTGGSGDATITNESNANIVFGTNNTERMRLNSTGLGIGTTSPSQPLHVYSTGNDIARIETNQTEGRLSLKDATGDAILKFRNDYRFTNSSGELVRIDTSGNIGIKNTVMASFSNLPATDLVVGAGTTNSGITIYSGTTHGSSIGFADGASGNARNQGIIQYHHNGDYMRFFTNATERMRIDSSGNVGIQNTTPSNFNASARQLVVGSGSGDNGITIFAGNTNNSSLFLADGTTGTNGYRGSVNYLHNGDALTLHANATETMRLTNGKVGVGTSSPGETIHAESSVATKVKAKTTTSTSLGGFEAWGNSTSYIKMYQFGSSYGGTTFGGVTGNNQAIIEAQEVSSLAFTTQGGTPDIIFAPARTARMTIKNGGNVGIGTASPSEKLEVNGTVKATAFEGDGSSLTNLPGGGKVLQVIGANDSTTRSTNSTSFTDASSTLTATITPSSTSSKVLIMMSIGTYKKAGGVQFITIYRGSTNLAGNDGFVANNGQNNNYSTAVVHLDSPSTTSATTYEFRMRSESSGDSQQINQAGGKSSFIVMEIGA